MVITVQCPSCQASYPVDTAKVPEQGVHARCSRCQGVFFVERPAPAEAVLVEPVGAMVAAPWEAPLETVPPEPLAVEPVGFDVGPTAPETAEPAAEPTAVPESVVELPRVELSVTTSAALVELPPPPPAAPAPEVAAPAAAPSAFSFGRRDPHEKARRLARVLVSDMIMYNPERHHRAIESGSLKDDFLDEIKKSWQEYVDQVGDEIARSTNYFNDALNDILAKGRQVF